MKFILGSDHSGFDLKNGVAAYLREAGHAVEDVGTHTADSCDYPDFASAVARGLMRHRADRGIIVDGVGGSSAMAANKFPGIRAVACHNDFTIRIAREHSDSNVLCLGSKLTDLETAKGLIESWIRIKALQDAKYKNRLRKLDGFEKENFAPHLRTHRPAGVRTRQVVSEADVRRAIRDRKPVYIERDTIITPSARDLAKEKNIKILSI